MSAKSLRNSFLKSLGPQDRTDFQHRLSDDDAEFLLDDWYRYARDEQLAPDGDWRIWRPGAEKIFPLNFAVAMMARPVRRGGANRLE